MYSKAYFTNKKQNTVHFLSGKNFFCDFDSARFPIPLHSEE